MNEEILNRIIKDIGKDNDNENNLPEKELEKRINDRIDQFGLEINDCREATVNLNFIMTDLSVKENEFLITLIALVRFMEKKDFRFLYHEISREAHNNKKNSDSDAGWEDLTIRNRDILDSFLFKPDYHFKHTLTPNNKKILIKILDHYNLVSLQTERLYEEIKTLESKANILDENYSKLSKDFATLENKRECLQNQLDKTQKRLKNSIVDVISVLGIFTGISFVMFGGLTMISSIALDSNYNTFFQFLLIGMLMVDTVVVLLQYIKSISDPDVYMKDLVYEKITDSKGSPTYFFYANVIVFYYLSVILSVEYRFEIKRAIEEITTFSLSRLPAFIRTFTFFTIVIIPIFAGLLISHNNRKAKQ
ncbi:hypothetical protein PT155_08635 [Erysipelothrix rhusiopathiae]|nr:hypothetical protein [Erysipelothrix rhusiopathiae]MDE8252279.1 hypothetical protein [Erysipelothrix rhusiopathiae]MDE8260743.1 hypothetical protein [Erysipelothrix rhusiopathiae]MDE8265813.1 hypothetical protein [Erysipelothrix rhusiopathiae]MDE8267536.1 hypothetical protein [Erysipelothrix rhusiopathiae]